MTLLRVSLDEELDPAAEDHSFQAVIDRGYA